MQRAPQTTGTTDATTGRLVRELAVHDWLLAVYFAALLLGLAFADAQPKREATLATVAAIAGAAATTVVAVRRGLLRPGIVAAGSYRVAVVGSLLGSYFVLRDVLPIINGAAYDTALRAIDIALFGTDPVVWLDRFVTPATTEWFAFFYYCYFFLLAAYALPMLASRRPRLQHELGLGIIGVFTTGHLLYLVVPGFGPHHAFGAAFPTPLPSGPWMDAVERAVRASGALKDIFPSLHTAASIYLLAFTVRHRHERPFGAAWPATAFVALNIIGGAVFLRWHYVIDIAAGLLLGGGAAALVPAVARWERQRRVHFGAGAVWPGG